MLYLTGRPNVLGTGKVASLVSLVGGKELGW